MRKTSDETLDLHTENPYDLFLSEQADDAGLVTCGPCPADAPVAGTAADDSRATFTIVATPPAAPLRANPVRRVSRRRSVRIFGIVVRIGRRSRLASRASYGSRGGMRGSRKSRMAIAAGAIAVAVALIGLAAPAMRRLADRSATSAPLDQAPPPQAHAIPPVVGARGPRLAVKPKAAEAPTPRRETIRADLKPLPHSPPVRPLDAIRAAGVTARVAVVNDQPVPTPIDLRAFAPPPLAAFNALAVSPLAASSSLPVAAVALRDSVEAASPAALSPNVTPDAAARPRSAAIQDVLDQYREAFNTLDSKAARAIWPSVDAKALGRAFDSVETQEVDLQPCQIDVKGARAVASCGGTLRYVPKVGNRTARVEERQWEFRLRQVNERWSIDTVLTR